MFTKGQHNVCCSQMNCLFILLIFFFRLQVIICGRQVMCSYLTQDIELRVVQHYVGPDGQTVVKEHCDCLEAERKLPSYVLEDAEMTELCVRARGDEDWSQDVQLERRDKGSSSSVVQVQYTKANRCTT